MNRHLTILRARTRSQYCHSRISETRLVTRLEETQVENPSFISYTLLSETCQEDVSPIHSESNFLSPEEEGVRDSRYEPSIRITYEHRLRKHSLSSHILLPSFSLQCWHYIRTLIPREATSYSSGWREGFGEYLSGIAERNLGRIV
jgi:hypothetical protein